MSSKHVYHESDSSDDEDITSQDIEKIQTLWKDVKEVSMRSLFIILIHCNRIKEILKVLKLS